MFQSAVPFSQLQVWFLIRPFVVAMSSKHKFQVIPLFKSTSVLLPNLTLSYMTWAANVIALPHLGGHWELPLLIKRSTCITLLLCSVSVLPRMRFLCIRSHPHMQSYHPLDRATRAGDGRCVTTRSCRANLQPASILVCIHYRINVCICPLFNWLRAGLIDSYWQVTVATICTSPPLPKATCCRIEFICSGVAVVN